MQMATSAEPKQMQSKPSALSNSTKPRSPVGMSTQVPSFADWAFPWAAHFTSALLMTRIPRGPVFPWGLEEPLELLLFRAISSGPRQPGAPTPSAGSLLSPGLALPAGNSRKL